jgi:hypothetical protein
MRNFKNLITSFLAVLSLFVVLISCSEDEEVPVYVGEWKTAEVPIVSAATEQMVFIFEKSSYEVEVYRDDTATKDVIDLKLATAITGSLTSPEDGKLDAVIEGVALLSKSYVYKETNNDAFYVLFNAGLGAILEESFTAEYSISGTTMNLSIPVKSEQGMVPLSLELTKK